MRLFRPATLDLILTKMMRGEDPQDLADIAFLVRHDGVTSAQIEAALADVAIPDLAWTTVGFVPESLTDGAANSSLLPMADSPAWAPDQGREASRR